MASARCCAGAGDVDAQAADALLVERVELGLRHLIGQHRDAARILKLRHGVQHAAIVGAIEARLHDHHAREPKPLEHGREVADRRIHRRVAAVRGQREARLWADHMHMAVARTGRRKHRAHCRASSAMPSANSTCGCQSNSLRSREESAVMCRTSPRRYCPVTTGCRPLERARQGSRHITDGARRARPDIEGAHALGMLLARQHGRGGDVAHVNEIPALAAVLKNLGRLAAPERRGEDRRHAGVRRIARHARAVDVVIAQRRDRTAGHPRPVRGIEFLRHLAAGIGVARIERRVLVDQAPSSASARTADMAARNFRPPVPLQRAGSA